LNMSSAIARVLVVDDEPNQRDALSAMIRTWGYDTAAAQNGAEALEKLRAFEADAIITDLNMPVMDGREFLTRRLAQDNPAPAIVLTGFGNVETAVETVYDLGAFWFLEKPVQSKALKLVLDRAVQHRRLMQNSEALVRQLSTRGVLGELVGESPAMREVFAVIQQVAPTRATVLITGETGTGKELAAKAIHDLSPRRTGPYLAINCAALPENLIESELFGHERGAFTGAVERRAGAFELARGGTLLLDEIGEMPLATQAKLLRVLEEGKVRRLGSSKEVDLDVRVIASTNRNLRQQIAKNEFREDLFFRLNVFEITLPPLRERGDDVLLIAASLIGSLNKKHETRVTGLEPEVATLFRRSEWPGNARELRNVLERAVILAGEGNIKLRHLPSALTGAPEAGSPDSDFLQLRPGLTVDAAERRLIELTLKHTGDNRTRAAELLGISAKTLFNKLKAYSAEGP
jgi:DNA-binding NtrC family response regulator